MTLPGDGGGEGERGALRDAGGVAQARGTAAPAGSRQGEADRDQQRVARANTEASVWYRGRCSKCLQSPDLDGEEYRATEVQALASAVDEAEWTLTEDGRLLCDDCLPRATRSDGCICPFPDEPGYVRSLCPIHDPDGTFHGNPDPEL